jgi:hypothetical protein
MNGALALPSPEGEGIDDSHASITGLKTRAKLRERYGSNLDLESAFLFPLPQGDD